MALVLLLGAVLPTVLYVTLLWWLDKYEKEPWGLFLAAFLYGCVPAVVLSVVLEMAVGAPRAGGLELVAPVVEESVKALAVLLIFFLWRREFDGILDGIIYGAVVGLGFAMVENILYFIKTAGDVGVIILRSLIFGLNHAFFTAFTGAGLGLARALKRRALWIVFFPPALGVAMAFHAVHNLAVAQRSSGLLIALVSDWGGVLLIVAVAVLSWQQERRWIRQELREEVAAGLLTAADHEALLSLSRRVGARLWMWRHRGWTAFRLLGRFFHHATELAFRKRCLRSEPASESLARDVEALRQQVRAVREALLNRGAA